MNPIVMDISDIIGIIIAAAFILSTVFGSKKKTKKAPPLAPPPKKKDSFFSDSDMLEDAPPPLQPIKQTEELQSFEQIFGTFFKEAPSDPPPAPKQVPVPVVVPSVRPRTERLSFPNEKQQIVKLGSVSTKLGDISSGLDDIDVDLGDINVRLGDTGSSHEEYDVGIPSGRSLHPLAQAILISEILSPALSRRQSRAPVHFLADSRE